MKKKIGMPLAAMQRMLAPLLTGEQQRGLSDALAEMASLDDSFDRMSDEQLKRGTSLDGKYMQCRESVADAICVAMENERRRRDAAH